MDRTSRRKIKKKSDIRRATRGQRFLRRSVRKTKWTKNKVNSSKASLIKNSTGNQILSNENQECSDGNQTFLDGNQSVLNGSQACLDGNQSSSNGNQLVSNSDQLVCAGNQSSSDGNEPASNDNQPEPNLNENQAATSENQPRSSLNQPAATENQPRSNQPRSNQPNLNGSRPPVNETLRNFSRIIQSSLELNWNESFLITNEPYLDRIDASSNQASLNVEEGDDTNRDSIQLYRHHFRSPSLPPERVMTRLNLREIGGINEFIARLEADPEVMKCSIYRFNSRRHLRATVNGVQPRESEFEE